jgi:hypothetical protein
MDAVNVDLDEMRARVDATHSIITSRQRVEATMTAEISTMRLDIGDIQEALKNHDSWMEDVSNTLQQMQEKEENLTEDIINLKNEMNTKLDTKVDNVAWKEANDDLDAAIKTVRDMVSSLRLDVDARRRKVDEILATIRHDITAVETNLEESKAKITSDTDQAVNALNGRIDFTNKDLAATQESLHTTQNSLSDCFNEVAVVRSDLERNVADTEARLKNDIHLKHKANPSNRKDHVDKDFFDAISNYLIPKPELARRHLTLNVNGKKICGYSIIIDDVKYPRNQLMFNMCFVCYPWSRTVQFEPAIRKFSEYLVMLEKENEFISREEHTEELKTLMEEVYFQLNDKHKAIVQVGRYMLNLKVVPNRTDPPPIHEWSVPVLLIDRNLGKDDWDLTTKEVDFKIL